MPNRHSKHEEDPYGSNLEILDASPASNNDDGDDESRQRQTVRQPDLGYASPRETADRLSDTEDSESLQLAMEMSMGLDEDSKGPRRKIPKTSTLGEAEASVLWQNEEVFGMARKMVRAGLSMEDVVEMWEAAIDPVDLVREMKEKEALKAEADRGGAQVHRGSDPSQPHPSPRSPEWESYDEDEWNTAIEGLDVDEEHWTDKPGPSYKKPAVPISEASFVRAMKDSDAGSKPYFKRGDVLRIIGHRRRRDQHFELLPLKSPGEAGRALRSDFEAVDQGDVDVVGKEAMTEKEKDCFRCAVEWED
ncbi:hypothetical protein HO133_005263 [Letharia lupina]|uniref:Uncharacterized protein n=1 Tax=Letharia lupina TaxID=560253 RepID=A0A8H6F8C2_9LECA|nr:uncharacterized protein HO133_005263 [Letharia lupina]KAF6218721.1 hypothetical protein HO133_005263 [Letharia lupina]